jgi:Ca2+-binding EF-hand superfamily protein
MSFVCEGRDNLYHDDLLEVLGPSRKEEAEECFASLDRDGNGDVSLDEMILTVTEVGRGRKSLARSMHGRFLNPSPYKPTDLTRADVDQAIKVLDKLLFTVVFVISVFVFGKFQSRCSTSANRIVNSY